MDSCSYALSHINIMAKWTTGGWGLRSTATALSMWEAVHLHISASNISHKPSGIRGGTKWSKDARTLIILDMLVLEMGGEIKCEIISHFFIPPRCLGKRYANNVILRMCCLTTPRTLSLSLATDDFIRLCKLFISLEVEKWSWLGKELCFDQTQSSQEGVGSLSLWYLDNKPPKVCLLQFAWEESNFFLVGVCCLLVSVHLARTGRVGVYACSCLCVWTDNSEVAPASNSVCCVCRLQRLVILESFSFFFCQLQSLTDLAGSRRTNHLQRTVIFFMVHSSSVHTLSPSTAWLVLRPHRGWHPAADKSMSCTCLACFS